MSNKIYCKIFVDLYFMNDMDKNGILDQTSDYQAPQTNHNRTFKKGKANSYYLARNRRRSSWQSSRDSVQ